MVSRGHKKGYNYVHLCKIRGPYFWERVYFMLFFYGFTVTGNDNVLTCSYILKQYGDKDINVGFTFNFFMFLTVLALKLFFNRNKDVALFNRYKHEPFIIKCMINCSTFYIIRKKFLFKIKFISNKLALLIKNFINKIIAKIKNFFK